MDRPIPSLNALRSFDATARHLNQTRAAVELHVTPSAISKQITALEDYFGFPLFDWQGKSMALTLRGEDCAKITSRAFRSLSRDLQHIMRPDEDPLRIVADMDFAQLWLVPRLDRFRDKHPDIQIDLKIMLDGPSAPDSFDCALFWGHREWERGAEIEPIFLNSVFVVGAPGAQATEAFLTGASIHGSNLLNDRSSAWWGRFVVELGLSITVGASVTYPTTTMCMAAAEMGQGLAIADEVTSRVQLESGSLQILSETKLQTADAYYAVWNADVSQDHRVRSFHDWLHGEAEEHRRWFDEMWSETRDR